MSRRSVATLDALRMTTLSTAQVLSTIPSATAPVARHGGMHQAGIET